jgi:hypothetical protein
MAVTALRAEPVNGRKTVGGNPLRRIFEWHRPLIAAALLMVVCALISVGGLLFDPRNILGVPAWGKPLKFSLSILLYTVTWAWFIAHLPRWRRSAHILGTIIAVTLIVEQIAIVWAASTGTTSHFNVSDGTHVIVWAVMAVAITVMYLCTFATSVAVFFLALPTRSLTFAVRAGVVIALIGIGIAFLMTGPTSTQLASPTGIVGAHAVGVADGGPGLPILGWSTVGGDYRVPHFIGMHALQALPLLAIALAYAGRRVPRLANPTLQLRLVVAAAIAYFVVVVLLVVQAAMGQPFIAL